MFDVLNGITCPICGKQFFPPLPSKWVYKVVEGCVCSYPCMLKGREKRARTAKRGKPMRPVEMYSPSGELLKTFDDVNVAAALLSCSPNMIRVCCRGELKTYQGRIWRYKKGDQKNGD